MVNGKIVDELLYALVSGWVQKHVIAAYISLSYVIIVDSSPPETDFFARYGVFRQVRCSNAAPNMYDRCFSYNVIAITLLSIILITKKRAMSVLGFFVWNTVKNWCSNYHFISSFGVIIARIVIVTISLVANIECLLKEPATAFTYIVYICVYL